MSDNNEVENKFENIELTVPDKVLEIGHVGRGIKLLWERKYPFDHKLCEKALQEWKTLPYERPFRPYHAEYLINCMKRHTFHQEWVRFIACEHDGIVWRMNAQHTAFARLELPERWVEQSQVWVSMYKADSEEAMRELYASIDRGAFRTKGNILNSYLAGTEQFQDVSQAVIRLLGEGMSLWLWESVTERKKHDADEISNLIAHQYQNITNIVLGACMEKPTITSVAFMRRSPVVAAMFETFNKVTAPSIEFWNAVKTGVGFTTVNDPRSRLRNALQNTRLHGSDSPYSGSVKNVERETIYRWCINAFNMWRACEDCKQLKTTSKRQKAK